MIDLHSHLIPGVDDGAEGADEARRAVERAVAAGVHVAAATPHLNASLTGRAELLELRLEELDEGWEVLREVARVASPGLGLVRGAEVLLDTPFPDLSDPRLRLAGTRFVLVEFPHMGVPVRSADTLARLRDAAGWTPVLAHPERYRGLGDLALVEAWRAAGAVLQVNAGSLLGQYGDRVRKKAYALLERGWAHLVCSDYHARGDYPSADARRLLRQERRVPDEALALLFGGNAARILDDQDPEPVPAIPAARLRHRRFWRRGR